MPNAGRKPGAGVCAQDIVKSGMESREESMLSILFGNLASNLERRTCSEISKSGMENPSDGACTLHLKLGVKPREGKHA